MCELILAGRYHCSSSSEAGGRLATSTAKASLSLSGGSTPIASVKIDHAAALVPVQL
jgi:hypothetical protein